MKKTILCYLLLAVLLASCGQATDESSAESSFVSMQSSTAEESSFAESVPDTSAEEDSSTEDYSAPDIDISVPDEMSGTTPEVGGTALEGKYGKYTFVSEENGLSVAGIYTAEQIKEFADKRQNGEWFALTEEEFRFLLADTLKLFEEYDLIRVTCLDGTVKTFAGVGYYATEEYNSLFNKVTSLPDLSFNLDEDVSEALIARINVMYPLVLRQEEIISSDGAGYDMGGMVVLGYEQPPSDSEYKALCGEIAYSYTFSKVTDMLKNNSRKVVFFENGINLRKVNDVEYEENLFNNFIPGKPTKHEFATEGKSVAIELYDEAAKRVVALLRITDPEQLAEIERMWVELFDNSGDTGLDDNKGVDKYRVCVFLNGFPNYCYSSINLNSFFYRYGENNDAWSTYGNFESAMFHLNGCGKIGDYLDKIIAETLGEVA